MPFAEGNVESMRALLMTVLRAIDLRQIVPEIRGWLVAQWLRWRAFRSVNPDEAR
jgi:hypothetical protein